MSAITQGFQSIWNVITKFQRLNLGLSDVFALFGLIQQVMDEDLAFRQRVTVGVELAGRIADLTPTETDDIVVDYIGEILENDAIIALLEDLLNVDGEDEINADAVHQLAVSYGIAGSDGPEDEVQGIPVAMIIEIAMLIFKIIRERRANR